jgi:hypothetical protein
MTTLTTPETVSVEASAASRLRSTAEVAFRDHNERDLERLQGEIDAISAKAVAASFEAFRDAADDLLRTLRVSFGQLARFALGDFRNEPSFYLGQLHALSEIVERVRQRRLPKDAMDLVARKEPAERILRTVLERNSIGAAELAAAVNMQESNLSTLCKELTTRQLLRADRFGKRVRYSPTPLTHAVVAHIGSVEPAPSLEPAPKAAAAAAGAAPDWPKAAAAAAAASFDPGNVMANTSDFASGIFTLGVLRGANAVVIEPEGDQVRLESERSEKEPLRLPKSIGRSLSEQMNAFITHGGTDTGTGVGVFDWCGQRVRAFSEPTRQGKRYRFEFLDKPKDAEREEKVHIAFREIEDEKTRLEDFLKFYAKEVLYSYGGEYVPAAKTLGIKPPELRSILK